MQNNSSNPKQEKLSEKGREKNQSYFQAFLRRA
jgi:hypothetical protein